MANMEACRKAGVIDNTVVFPDKYIANEDGTYTIQPNDKHY